MDKQQISDLLSIASQLMPVVIALIKKITSVINESPELTDADRDALLLIINDMQMKVDNLQDLT